MLVEKGFKGLLKHLNTTNQETLDSIVSILFNTLAKTTDTIVKKFLNISHSLHYCYLALSKIHSTSRVNEMIMILLKCIIVRGGFEGLLLKKLLTQFRNNNHQTSNDDLKKFIPIIQQLI